MVEVGVIIGYLVTWAIRKARRAGAKLDSTVDAAMDIGLDRLDSLVRTKLGGHPALKELDDEAAQAPTAPTDDAEAGTAGVTELTRQQLELSLQSALAKDTAFAGQLRALMDELKPVMDNAGGTSITMNAQASGHGRVYQAGRDQHISGQ